MTGNAPSATALSRRGFLSALTMAGAHALLQPMSNAWAQGRQAPALVTPDNMRPAIPYGVASGDVTHHSAIIWSRTDRPARLIVEYASTESMRYARRMRGPAALQDTDFTAKLDLTGLPAGQRIFYRVYFEDLANPKHDSEPVMGSFLTAPQQKRDLHIVWSGDTAGQGFGINPDWGGMKIYHTMHQMQPDLFIHSGDYVYADGPIPAEIPLDDGGVWKNLTTPEKAKVAETLAEFRGNYVYNLLDEHVRRFNAAVPQLVQWDDHETLNNWYPGEQLLNDDRYTVKSASLLAARGKRAFFEYTPIREYLFAPERIYRAFSYGPSLDIFMLDMRTYRGPNTYNRQPNASADTVFLGAAQIAWLKHRLRTSKATWKVIASDMPIGLIVRDGEAAFENLSNGDGIPLGRELEMADLLRSIKSQKIVNVVWLTADVHYAAAHHYDPNKAQFQDFAPFWEFVAGPLHAGTFGPNDLDNTFGPQVAFKGVPDGMRPNRPPSDGLQFFGSVRVDGKTEVMTVSLYNLEGARIYSVDLEPTLTRS
jgi:alkaline phosphatase D